MGKSINIKSFLPQREIEICRRLHQARTEARLAQAELAQKLGITRVRLASYEYAKAPIRYELGKRICWMLDLNQRWFATGQDPRRPYFDLSQHLEYQIAPKALFSAAFDAVLKPKLEDKFAEVELVVGKDRLQRGEYDDLALSLNHPLVGEEPGQALASYARLLVQTMTRMLPRALAREYAIAIIKADKLFFKKHRQQIDAAWADKEAIAAHPSKDVDLISSKALTTPSDYRSIQGMTIRHLLADVQRLTKGRGMKAALAKHLQVSQSRITEWLSGKSEPAGQATLDLFEWVQEQKGKTTKMP